MWRLLSHSEIEILNKEGSQNCFNPILGKRLFLLINQCILWTRVCRLTHFFDHWPWVHLIQWSMTIDIHCFYISPAMTQSPSQSQHDRGPKLFVVIARCRLIEGLNGHSQIWWQYGNPRKVKELSKCILHQIFHKLFVNLRISPPTKVHHVLFA